MLPIPIQVAADPNGNPKRSASENPQGMKDPKRQRVALQGADAASLSNLVPEIGHQIFLRLGLDSIRSCSLVCRSLCKMTQGDTLWQKLFVRDLSSYFPEKMNSQSMHEVYKAYHCSRLNISKERYAIRAWSFSLDPTLFGLTFTGGKICILSRTNKPYIFDLREEALYRISPCFPGHIECFLLAEGKLFLGKRNGTIEVWNVKTGMPLGGVQKIGEEVTGLILANGRFFSISRQLLYSYDLPTGNRKAMCRLSFGNNAEFMCKFNLLAFGESLVVRNFDPIKRLILINLLNLNTMLMEPLEIPGGVIKACVSSNGKLFVFFVEERNIASGKKGTIRGFDEEKNCLIDFPVDDFEWEHDIADELFMAADSGMLFLASGNHLKVFDIDTGRCLSSLHEAVQNVWGVMNSKIVSFNRGIGGVVIYDFAADHDAIFASIAQDYRCTPKSTVEEIWKRADQRFRRMPDQEKNLIYQKCYDILGLVANNLIKYEEDAFFSGNDLLSHCWSDLYSTREQKARAIEAYLQERKKNKGYEAERSQK